MKRMLAIILCLVLCMALLPVQALAAEGDLIVARTDDGPMKNGLETFCGAGDALYFLLYGRSQSGEGRSLGVHHVGEAEMKLYELKLGEELEGNSYEDMRLLSDGGQVFVLRQVSSYEEDMQSIAADLYALHFEGDEVQAELFCTPDWSIFRSESGYYNYVESFFCAGEYVIAIYYDDYGMMNCVRMPLAGGSFEVCGIDGEISRAVAYSDGRLLIQQYADQSYTRLRFMSYDPATDACEALCEVETEQYGQYEGMACDLESGAVYYTKQGEIFELDLKTGESSEAITDMPGTMYSSALAAVLDGGYYAGASYDCYVFRNLHPEKRPETTLRIYDGSYDDSVSRAFYTFANSHGEVATVLSRDYSSQNSLVEDMMNRSDDIDVYVISADSADYQAVFGRGYMAELTENEVLRAAAERMYPAMREALSIDGELCAMPVSCYFWIPFVNRETMEKLGLEIGDIPTNWDDFLDFLVELEGRLPEDGSIIPFDSYQSDVEARRSVFDRIFVSYQQLLQADPDAVSTEQMAALLQKLERVDFRALGQPSEEEVQNEEYFDVRDGRTVYYLFEMNTGTTLENIAKMQPLVMSLTADTPRMLAVSASVAFVNPFSKNRELALEYIEGLVENLPESAEYVIFADKSEPVENRYYQDNMAQMQKSIDKLREQYASAEEADKQALMEMLDIAEENMKEYKQYRFSISEADIVWLKQYADLLTLQGNNWLYSDNSGEAFQLVQQYCEGQLDARKLMDEIGRKIRMMMMEGY